MPTAARGGGTARLTLLCHASTAAVRSGAFPLDEALDAKGLASATALAGRLTHRGRALTSPTRRAHQTAAVLGLEARDEYALRDCDFGRWNGRGLSEVAATETEAIAQWLADPASAPHGGESIVELVERVGAWMDFGAVKGKLWAVTHTAVIRAAVLHVLDAPASSFWRIDAGPLTSFEFRRGAGRWVLYAISAG